MNMEIETNKRKVLVSFINILFTILFPYRLGSVDKTASYKADQLKPVLCCE